MTTKNVRNVAQKLAARTDPTSLPAEPTTGAGDGLLDQAEAARFIHTTPRTLSHWRKMGIIPYFKIGRARNAAIRFKRSDLEDALEKWRVN